MCTALVPAGQVQPDLFDRQDRQKSSRLMAVLDAINDRWGAGTLAYASSGLMKACKRSVTIVHPPTPPIGMNCLS